MLSHIRWGGLFTASLAVVLVLVFNRCEKNPVITWIPADQLEYHRTRCAVNDTTFSRAATHGNSHTLYAGPIDQEGAERVSSILIRFAEVDSSQLAKFQSAQLVLFRRTVGEDTLSNQSLEFSLSVVESPVNDTIWTESDTAGHVEMGSLITTPIGTASMNTDTVAVPTSSTVADLRTGLEYLAFSVDTTTLSSWREGEIANNGFLVQQENPSELIGFHSRNGYALYPYLAITFSDTSSTGAEDTTVTYYYLSSEDISIYDRENPVYYDGALHLDHSNGIRAHIELDTDLIDTTSIVLGARLVLYANLDESTIIADQVDIQIFRRAQLLGDGDSTVVFPLVPGGSSIVTYNEGADSLSFNLYYYLLGLVTGSYGNHGLDLVVLPRNHDFDHLVFWGSEAEDALKPRLELDYGSFYKEMTW